MKEGPQDRLEAFGKGLKGLEKSRYVLKLYVAGATPRSNQAILNIKKICEEHLFGRYELEVIDVYQQPVLARGEQIIATPTLIKKLPAPLRRFIGTMADTERVLLGLDIRKRGALPQEAAPSKGKKDGKQRE